MSKEGIQKRSVLRRRSHGQPQNISFRFLAPSCMKEKQPARNLLCIGSKKFDNIHFFPALALVHSLPISIRWKENDQCCAHREGRGVGSTWYQNTEFPYVCKWFIRGAPAGQHSYYFWMTLIVWFAIYLLPSCLISAALHTVDVSGVVAWRIILSKLFNDAPLQIDHNTRIVLHVLECLWPALVL